MNSWEDKRVNAAVTGYGRKKIVIAGLWTEVCVCFPAVEAIAEGYDVHVPTDSCGDVTIEAHERAIQRAIQAGGVPMTTLQVMFEWQRDWARPYDGCMEVLKAHSAFRAGNPIGDCPRCECDIRSRSRLSPPQIPPTSLHPSAGDSLFRRACGAKAAKKEPNDEQQ
jgi:Isochorismatase family